MNSRNAARLALRALRWCSVAGACVSLAAAAATPARTATVTTGRPVTVGDTSRIISIGGAVTEILYALGLAKNITAVDTTSLYPPQAMQEKPNVGYMRQLSAEGVLGMNPTLILSIETAGPKETIAILQAAKIPLVVVPDAYSGEGIIDKIRIIADAVGVPERGKCLIEQVRTDLDTLARIEKKIEKPRRVLFALSFVNGRAMVSGQKTAADGIIRMAGGVNSIREYDGYKPINDEAVVAAKPDVVLAMDRGGPLNLTAGTVFKHPGFAATPAAADKAFVSMDGLYLLGFGPRSARAARDLATTLYPELKGDVLPSERAAANPCRP